MAVNKFDNSMFDAGTIGTTANKLLQLDGSTKIPAVDGSLLTSIPSSFTKSASDPVITTNPSGGVGSLWANTTSGEVYCCTDATAGANVWTNVGAGTGDVIPWNFQGSEYGFSLAGYRAGPVTNIIEKFSLTSDANATDVGDLLYAAQGVAGGKGTTHGYACGGETAPKTQINKFSFSTDGNGTDVGDLTIGRAIWSHSASSGTYCYQHGGESGGNSYRVVIDKFSVTADANATDVGDLALGLKSGSCQSSSTYGYSSAGKTSPGQTDMVQRYAFASDGNAVDTTQNLTISAYSCAGTSSTTYGYVHGANGPSGRLNVIQKFQFDTSNNATDVGDLTQSVDACSGHSSTTHGYRSGGAVNYINVIDKYPFATDSNATDVGDLAAGGEEVAGTHN